MDEGTMSAWQHLDVVDYFATYAKGVAAGLGISFDDDAEEELVAALGLAVRGEDPSFFSIDTEERRELLGQIERLVRLAQATAEDPRAALTQGFAERICRLMPNLYPWCRNGVPADSA